MALDSQHRLFVGCRKPAKVIVYDGDREETGVRHRRDTDDLFYDSQRKRHVSGGEASSMLARARRRRSRGGVSRPLRVRTALFAPEQGKRILAVPHRVRKAEIRVYEIRD
jgi:hypothetical protein